jgi:hypothetical protein
MYLQGDSDNDENLSEDGYNYLDIVRKIKATEYSKVLEIVAAKRASEDSLITDWMVCVCLYIYIDVYMYVIYV